MTDDFEDRLKAALERDADAHPFALSADDVLERRAATQRRQPFARPVAGLLAVATVAMAAAAVSLGLGALRSIDSSGALLGSTSANPSGSPAPALADLVPLKTQQPRPSGAPCMAARIEGTLVNHSEDGLALRQGDESITRVIWPYGYFARRGADGLELVDGDGIVRAREGDRIVLGGGENEAGIWMPCGGPTKQE
jgi:hypothetical protein